VAARQIGRREAFLDLLCRSHDRDDDAVFGRNGRDHGGDYAKVQQEKVKEVVRAEEIKQICDGLEARFSTHPYIRVDCVDNRISFGDAGRFGHNDYRLPPEAGASLAQLVPAVLETADNELGRKWFKQIVIEGFTDTDGSYLYNLHLSLQRSEWAVHAAGSAPEFGLEAVIGTTPASARPFLPVASRSTERNAMRATTRTRTPVVASSFIFSSMG
jgi:hypothetical protein